MIGAIAVATLGIYLLIVGVIGLFGWFIAAGMKKQVSEPHLLPAAAQTAAPPPQSLYRPVVPVDPKVFDQPSDLEAAAKTAFVGWARQLPKAPRDARDAIRSLALRRRLIGRLTTKLDGKRFVWRSSSYRGRDRTTVSKPIDPMSLDPYNPPSDLRVRSSYLSLCSGCGGDGMLECISCGGAGRVTCGGCSGAGKTYGYAKNGSRRLLNCKDCKGKATLLCHPCKKGQIECRNCERTGRVEHWLDIEGGPRDADVQVEPDGDQTRAFTWGKDGALVPHDEIVKDARILCSVAHDRPLTLNDLPAEVPNEWRSAHWQALQAQLQPGERIVAQSFALLEVPSVEVTYSLDNKDAQTIELEGLRLLAPPVSTDQLFDSRARGLRRLAIGLGIVPLLVFVAYAVRGPYFLKPELAGIVLGAAIAAAITYGVFWHSTLGRSTKKWLVAAVPPIAAAVVLAFSLRPTVATAKTFIEEEQLDAAVEELEALGGRGESQLSHLWAEIDLKRVHGTKSCGDAKVLAQKIAIEPHRVRAIAHADALALSHAESAFASNDLEATERALACASEVAQQGQQVRGLRARSQLLQANRCVLAADWTCAVDRSKEAARLGATKEAEEVRAKALEEIRATVDKAVVASKSEQDLAARVALQRTAIDLWNHFLLAEAGSEPPHVTALKAAALKDQQALARIQDAERARREADEKRREAEAKRKRDAEERAEKRRLAEEERRQRAREPRSLRCCDGTLSPSCMCGGSRRGCCSHHGGVCGCE